MKNGLAIVQIISFQARVINLLLHNGVNNLEPVRGAKHGHEQ